MDGLPPTEESGLEPLFKRVDLSNKVIDPKSLRCEQCGLPLGKKMADCPQRPSGHCPYLFSEKRFYSWHFPMLALVGALVLWGEGTQRQSIGEQIFFYSLSVVFIVLAVALWQKTLRLRHKMTGETWSQSLPIARGTINYMPGSSVQHTMVVPPDVELPTLLYPVSIAYRFHPHYQELPLAEDEASINLVADTIATVLLWLVGQRAIDVSYWPTYHQRYFGKLLEPDLSTTLHITFTALGRETAVYGRLENKILKELNDFLPEEDFSGVSAFKSVAPATMAKSLGITRSKYKKEAKNPGLYEYRYRKSVQKFVWQDMVQIDLVLADKEHRLDASHPVYREGQLIFEVVEAFRQANPKMVTQLFGEIRSSLT